MKKLSEYPMYIQAIGIPFAWAIMIIKILIALPVYVIGLCNQVMND